MARISYIKAEGLWSHLESTFEFSPGMTVITGLNDTGKSSIFRIIRWVFLGEPAGESFIWTLRDPVTHEILKQAAEGRAEVGLDNGVVITKTRKKGKTVYTHSEIAEPFEKAEVPEEIRAALGLQEYVFGDFTTLLNFAFQLDAPFLISETPSIGAKVLGKLAGTEVIDMAISEQAKLTHKARDDKRIAERAIEKATGDLLDYMDIDDYEKQLQAAEWLLSNIDDAAAKSEQYIQLLQLFDTSTEAMSSLQQHLKQLEVIPALQTMLQDTAQLESKYNDLSSLQSAHNVADYAIRELSIQLLHYLQLPEAAIQLDRIRLDSDRVAALAYLALQYEQQDKEITEHTEFLKRCNGIPEASQLLEQVQSNNEHSEALNAVLIAHTLAVTQIADIKSKLDSLASIDDANKLLEATRNLYTRLDTLQQVATEYMHSDSTQSQAAKAREDAIKGYEDAQRELQQVWDDVGGICPLCNQPVDDAHRHG